MSAGGFRHPDYEVFGELGRGAFGTVYRARRKGMQDCAVKVFDPGRVDLARAARELEKLQRVQEHRGVVTVYDFDLSGEAPFYAMGLHAERDADGVWRGRTLAGLCRKVPEKEAWRLIADIAEALAYLHEHEVIHCDVKPGNVLLTDERPVGVKVCDFGQSRGSAGQWGERAGTVGYAAPEQLERPGESGEGKGYRWDVYAFGVTAYELLTGKWPRLEGVRTESAGDAATLRESLAGASLHEAGEGGMVAEVADRLRAEGDAVRWPAGAKLDRELCAVIERCLAMDPTKRFGDMRAVADALRAVETRRALARSRRVLATVCGLAGLAVVGGVGAAWQWQKAVASEKRTEASLSRAEALVEYMTAEMLDKLRPLGHLDILGSLLGAVEQYHADRDKAEAEGQEKRSASEIRRRATGLARLAGLFHTKGDLDGALRLFGQARDQLLELASATPDDVESREELVRINRAAGLVSRSKGDLPGAMRYVDDALALAESLVATAPASGGFLYELADTMRVRSGLFRAKGDLDEALAALGRAIDILEGTAAPQTSQGTWHRRLAQCYDEMGEVQKLRGDMAGALKSRTRAVEIADKVAIASPEDAIARSDLAVRLTRLATLLLENGKPDAALAAIDRAIEIRKRLDATDPDNLNWKFYLAGALAVKGNVQVQMGDMPGALVTRQRNIAIREHLVEREPGNMEWLRMLGTDLRRMADTRWKAGDLEAALASIVRSDETLAKTVSAGGNDAEWRYDWFQTVEAEAKILADLGRAADALETYRRAQGLIESLIAANGLRPAWQKDIKRIEEAIRGLEAARVP